MSVIPLKADIHQHGLHVRLVPLAHISTQFYKTTLRGLQHQSPIWAAAVFNTLSSDLVCQTIKYLAGTTGKMSAAYRKRRDGRIDLSSIREPIGFGGG
jgi:hypothetical protein